MSYMIIDLLLGAVILLKKKGAIRGRSPLHSQQKLKEGHEGEGALGTPTPKPQQEREERGWGRPADRWWRRTGKSGTGRPPRRHDRESWSERVRDRVRLRVRVWNPDAPPPPPSPSPSTGEPRRRRPPLRGDWVKIGHGLAEFNPGRADTHTKFTGMVSFEPLSFFKLNFYPKPSLIVWKLDKIANYGFGFGRGWVRREEWTSV